METALGDTLFSIILYILGFTFVIGWIVLILVSLLQWLFPKYENKLKAFLQKLSKPLSFLQKYSLWAIAILFIIRLLAGWLGWT